MTTRERLGRWFIDGMGNGEAARNGDAQICDENGDGRVAIRWRIRWHVLQFAGLMRYMLLFESLIGDDHARNLVGYLRQSYRIYPMTPIPNLFWWLTRHSAISQPACLPISPPAKIESLSISYCHIPRIVCTYSKGVTSYCRVPGEAVPCIFANLLRWYETDDIIISSSSWVRWSPEPAHASQSWDAL